MKKLFLIVLIIVGCIALFDLLHPGLPITNDGKDHVARIANFYQNLQQGNLIPRWAGNLNWGYGHPILEFLYPLPSYLASVFHFVGFSFIDAAKVVFAIGMLVSGICMYLWLAEFLPIPAAFIGGILYIFSPYRFVELYVRGDIGENLAFVFMPLTLLFLYRLYKNKQILYIILAAVSFACLMLSHNAMVLMYFPFILGYCLYLIYLSKDKKYVLYATISALVLGFVLSAFFWVPALLEGKYTLRNVVTTGEYVKRFVSINDLVYSPWKYTVTGNFTKELGIINWVVMIISLGALFTLWKKRDKNVILIGGLLLYTIVSIFLMLPQSVGIWQKIMLLQNFQFPWRFLAIPVFSTAVLGGFTVSLLQKKYHLIIAVVLLVLILFFNKDYWHADGYIHNSDNFFSSIYDGTTDTGESSPIWSIRFMEKRPKQRIELIAGTASVAELQRNITKHTYSVNASTDIVLRDNTVYFPGWEVLQDAVLVPIQYQDPHNRGVITFPVTKGSHVISVEYKETKLRIIADMISIAGLFLIIVLCVTNYITKNAALRYNKHNS